MLPITICIIGKNEENNIDRCLQSLLPYGFEIQYTDTGSVDHTLDLVSRYPAQISHFTWCNDFSAARNFNISQSANDWILCIDCDEVLVGLDIAFVKEFLSASPESLGRVELLNHYTQDGASHRSTEHISRFFNRKYYTYGGSIHEQLVPIVSASLKTTNVPIVLEHFGYEGDKDFLQAKASRNISLLKQQLALSNPDPYLYFQLGQSYFMLEDYHKASGYFDLGLAFDLEPTDDFVLMMVESYGYCLIYTQEYEKALQFTGIYDSFSFHADFVFLMGLIYMYNCLFDLAILEFIKASALTAYRTEGVNSYLSFYNIGVIYECQEDFSSAISYYRKAADSGYSPACDRLKKLTHQVP